MGKNKYNKCLLISDFELALHISYAVWTIYSQYEWELVKVLTPISQLHADPLQPASQTHTYNLACNIQLNYAEMKLSRKSVSNEYLNIHQCTWFEWIYGRRDFRSTQNKHSLHFISFHFMLILSYIRGPNGLRIRRASRKVKCQNHLICVRKEAKCIGWVKNSSCIVWCTARKSSQTWKTIIFPV